MHLVISCSLNENSKSRIMARHALKLYGSNGMLIDLSEYSLPLCDGDSCYSDNNVKELRKLIESSKTIILASPIYNYDLNAVAKNLIELTGRIWTDKVVGFICSAGGQRSYMSPMSFANSLMIDFRCIIIPRFVYTDYSGFSSDNQLNSDIKERIKELVDASKKLVNVVDK